MCKSIKEKIIQKVFISEKCFIFLVPFYMIYYALYILIFSESVYGYFWWLVTFGKDSGI